MLLLAIQGGVQVGVRPNPSVRLELLKLKFRLQNKDNDLPFLFVLRLGSQAQQQVGSSFLFFDGHRNYHVLDSQRLDVEESLLDSSLLQLVNLDLFGDQSENGDVVGFIVVHAHGVCFLGVFPLSLLVSFLLNELLLHFIGRQYLVFVVNQALLQVVQVLRLWNLRAIRVYSIDFVDHIVQVCGVHSFLVCHFRRQLEPVL